MIQNAGAPPLSRTHTHAHTRTHTQMHAHSCTTHSAHSTHTHTHTNTHTAVARCTPTLQMHDLRRLVHPESVINRRVYVNVPERQTSSRARAEAGGQGDGVSEKSLLQMHRQNTLAYTSTVTHTCTHTLTCTNTNTCIHTRTVPLSVPTSTPSKSRVARQAAAAAHAPCPDGTQVCLTLCLFRHDTCQHTHTCSHAHTHTHVYSCVHTYTYV